MYFECVGDISISDSVLKNGTEPIIFFRLSYVLKLGLVLPVSIMGMSYRLSFSVFKCGTWC